MRRTHRTMELPSLEIEAIIGFGGALRVAVVVPAMRLCREELARRMALDTHAQGPSMMLDRGLRGAPRGAAPVAHPSSLTPRPSPPPYLPSPPAAAAAPAGAVPRGLHVTPDGHEAWPLGACVFLTDAASGRAVRLSGHGANAVTCLALSPDGRFLASGERADALSKADVAVWDVAEALAAAPGEPVRPVARLVQHRGAVQALAFSGSGGLLASLGGADDNALVVWSWRAHKPLARAEAARHASHVVAWHHGSDERLVTAGVYHARQWTLHAGRGLVVPEDLSVGSTKRVFTTVLLDAGNARLFLGSTSGDILSYTAGTGQLACTSPERYVQGITALALVDAPAYDSHPLPPATSRGGRSPGSLPTHSPPAAAPTTTTASTASAASAHKPPPPRRATLVVGTGAGAIVRLRPDTLDAVGEGPPATVEGAVTSLAVAAGRASAAGPAPQPPPPPPPRLLVGTAASNVYALDVRSMGAALLRSGHAAPLVDAAWPAESAEIFVTAAGSELRVWACGQPHVERLRVCVPGVRVLCVAVAADGGLLHSGWDDGKLRCFTPEKGRLALVVHDAQPDAVTALAATTDGRRVMTGGRDGRVRLWALGGLGGGGCSGAPTLEFNCREHRAEVTSLAVSVDGAQGLSSSADGSCVVWSLARGARVNALFATTVFRAVLYAPGEAQLVTVGSDRRIAVWDAAECRELRGVEGADSEVRTAPGRGVGGVIVSSVHLRLGLLLRCRR